MPMVDTNGLSVTERLPGWQGRCFSFQGHDLRTLRREFE